MSRELTILKLNELLADSFFARRKAHDKLNGITRELARRKHFAHWRDFRVVYENEYCPIVIFYGFGRLAGLRLVDFHRMTRKAIIETLAPYMNPYYAAMLKEKKLKKN